MNFVHEDPEFEHLVAIVSESAGIPEALIEKDYWITHVLWALMKTGLYVWLKRGTSLSKGFGLIVRFSEDLDLVIRPGNVAALPAVTNWTSTNRGPVSQRRSYYDTLPSVLDLPSVKIEQDLGRADRQARGADYLVYYPGTRLEQLPKGMSPFIRMEVGHARVEPWVSTRISSFVHDYLEDRGILGGYEENRPHLVRCVHPLVTLFEKLDSLARHYARDQLSPESFVRHYEDMARIIQEQDQLPETEMTPRQLAQDLFTHHIIRTLPNPEEPALHLADPEKSEVIHHAYLELTPMYWGPRIQFDEICRRIRSWLVDQGF